MLVVFIRSYTYTGYMQSTARRLLDGVPRIWLELVNGIDRRWLVIWIMIYSSFIFLDLVFPQYVLFSSVLKYAGIFLCVVYTYDRYRKDTRLVLAMLMTFLADTILMVIGAKLIGVYVFCFAQMFHTLRLSRIPNVALRVYFAILFLVFVSGTLWGIPSLYVICFVYACTLITNLLLSWRWYKTDASNIRAACCFFGFILFLCCDINVGLSYLSFTGGIHSAIAPISSFLVFIFYYPSQILLSNSSNMVKPVKLPR
jgi:hypothetical protein